MLKSNIYKKLKNIHILIPIKTMKFYRQPKKQKRRQTIYQRKLSVLINTSIEKKWVTSKLLKLVVRKDKLYEEWKSTTDDHEYQILQFNFKTYEVL